MVSPTGMAGARAHVVDGPIPTSDVPAFLAETFGARWLGFGDFRSNLNGSMLKS